NYEVKIKCSKQTHAFAAHIVVNPNKRLVQKNQPRSYWTGRLIVCCCGRELGNSESNGFFASRAGAVCAASQPLPSAVLLAFDDKAVPHSIIERKLQVVRPRACLIVFANRFDLLLEKLAELPAVSRRPCAILPQKQPPNLIETRRSCLVDFPFEAQRHSSTHGPAFDFGIHPLDEI